MNTYIPKKNDIVRNWYVVDAEGKVLGRLASDIARVLSGKHKPTYVPFLDSGDFVVVVNVTKMVITGRKTEQKVYRYHTGYPGGLKETSMKKVLATKPEDVLFEAVKGMLPKTKLARQMIKKLKIYSGPEHQHKAQKPLEWKF